MGHQPRVGALGGDNYAAVGQVGAQGFQVLFAGRDEEKVRDSIWKLLADKPVRDYGETEGTLLPNHEVEIDVVCHPEVKLGQRVFKGIVIFARCANHDECQRAVALREECPLDVCPTIQPACQFLQE